MARERKYCGTSRWKKEREGGGYPLTLRVETEKKDKFGHCTAIFVGHNPFPCFSMETSFPVLAAWLKANGWVQYGDTWLTMVEDSINDDTGEIWRHANVNTTIRKEA